jgi:hypothetical protein
MLPAEVNNNKLQNKYYTIPAWTMLVVKKARTCHGSRLQRGGGFRRRHATRRAAGAAQGSLACQSSTYIGSNKPDCAEQLRMPVQSEVLASGHARRVQVAHPIHFLRLASSSGVKLKRAGSNAALPTASSSMLSCTAWHKRHWRQEGR